MSGENTLNRVVRATTPTITCTFADGPASIDLTAAYGVYLTLSQGTVCITKSGEDLEITPQSCTAYLEQADTILFKGSQPVAVQVNWTYQDGRRGCSNIVYLSTGENLLPEVLS